MSKLPKPKFFKRPAFFTPSPKRALKDPKFANTNNTTVNDINMLTKVAFNLKQRLGAYYANKGYIGIQIGTAVNEAVSSGNIPTLILKEQARHMAKKKTLKTIPMIKAKPKSVQGDLFSKTGSYKVPERTMKRLLANAGITIPMKSRGLSDKAYLSMLAQLVKSNGGRVIRKT